MPNIQIGQIYYNDLGEHFWLCTSISKNTINGRVSKLKRCSKSHSLELMNELTDKNSYRVNDEISIGYKRNLDVNFEEVKNNADMWNEFVTLVGKLSEEELNDFLKKEIEYV